MLFGACPRLVYIYIDMEAELVGVYRLSAKSFSFGRLIDGMLVTSKSSLRETRQFFIRYIGRYTFDVLRPVARYKRLCKFCCIRNLGIF